MITQIAEQLSMDQTKLRIQNMYKEGNICFANGVLNDWYVPEMFETIICVDYAEKKREIEKFNETNVWKKRGIAVIPMRYGVAFGPAFLNQGAASCMIYTDGSVLIHAGGIEMGQGLNTKLIHIAANTLQIDESQIYICETSTSTIPNAVPSAASASTDLIGVAVMKACEILAERLRPYRTQMPDENLAKWANCAFMDRVSLVAHGFQKTPNIDYDYEANTGTLYPYFTQGVASSIVELDVLTGDHTILRSDVLMDVGRSINYAVDVGQVEGAFVQGIGLFTIEDVLHGSASGGLATRGPGSYKIPTAECIPQEFNVKFLKNKEYKNLNNLKKSKGIGEPPLLLAFSVFLALRDAVMSAR
jgi:xanthine dehydrogenase/oxidase